ncbi:MAG: ATP-binding protein [Elusimicrobiota bacterium]
MKFFKRYLFKQTEKDLKEKMVFICGPRQVGKTTLARQIFRNNPTGYLNWDIDEHRERILKHHLPVSEFWIFDEIHKYKGWRNFLKGLYDLHGPGKKILVTGSGRLDFYRFGGDSLQGRYHFLRLHPLSVGELKIRSQNDFRDLLRFGGFPEPFFRSSEAFARRWSREYRTRFIKEDVEGLETIQDIGKLELLILRLPELVGSPLSLNSLREDLQLAHKTLNRWVNVLERMYSIFRISPFGAAKIRSVKKEKKHYHFDWTLIKDFPLRFENLVAAHLIKWANFQEDALGKDIELRYFRDVDGREIDFVIMEDAKPVWFVECKWSDVEISKSLKYMKNKFKNCRFYQIYFEGTKEYISKEGIIVMPALKFLQNFL